MASKLSQEPFEVLYTRLEETVAKLEGGNLSLEESLALYEEGMKLAVQCQERLQGAELRITKLQAQFAEATSTLREMPPEYGNDELAEGDLDDE
jgi:exodeoxyribonuclease VII small subunit